MDSTSIASVNFASHTSIASTSANNEDSSGKNISGLLLIKYEDLLILIFLGDDRLDDSPRKRQRKQQFDNTQQLQDKLMVCYFKIF